MSCRVKKGTELMRTWPPELFRLRLEEADFSIKKLCSTYHAARNSVLDLYHQYYTPEERKALRSKAISVPKPRSQSPDSAADILQSIILPHEKKSPARI